MIGKVFSIVKQFKPFQWGHNTLCSKTMLSPKRNSRQLWKKPQFLPRPQKSKYFRNRIVFTRIVVVGVLNHPGERFQKGAQSVADSLVSWVHSTHQYFHIENMWNIVKLLEKIHPRFLPIKHISFTVVFVVKIPDVDHNGLQISKVPDHKPENKVFDLGKKSPPLLLSPNTWPL